MAKSYGSSFPISACSAKLFDFIIGLQQQRFYSEFDKLNRDFEFLDSELR